MFTVNADFAKVPSCHPTPHSPLNAALHVTKRLASTQRIRVRTKSLHGLTFKLPMEGHGTAQLNFNFTRLSKALAGVLCLGYAVQLVFPTAREYLTLVPGRCGGRSLVQSAT